MKNQAIQLFNADTAHAQVQAAEDACNSGVPDTVLLSYTLDCEWRYREQLAQGHDAVKALLTCKWKHELHYKLKNELWAYVDNHLAIRFEYEWQHSLTGQWYRSHGSELWEFSSEGLLSRVDTSTNDISIDPFYRRIGFS